MVTSPRYLLSVALLAATLTISRPALAMRIENGNSPIELDFTETADLDYFFPGGNGNISPPKSFTYDPTSNNVFMWLNRFQVQGTMGPWHAELKFDSALFLNAPAVSDVSTNQGQTLAKLLENRYVDNFILQQVSASYASQHLDATVGDFHVSYGRGLVLSLHKVDQLGVDTTLRGANVTGRVAGFTANVVGGITNVVNTDPATGSVAPNPEDPILGGRLEYRLPGLFAIGVDGAVMWQNPNTIVLQQYRPGAPASQLEQVQLSLLGFGSATSEVWPTNVPLPTPSQTQNYSATLELPNLFGHGSAYFEFAHQLQWNSNQLEQGNAFYGEISAFVGPFTLQAELKDYLYYAYPTFSSLSSATFPAFYQQDVYNNPPNLEEIWQEELVSNPGHTYGPRFRLDWQATDNVKPFATVSYFVDDGNAYDIYNASAGVEGNWQAKHEHVQVTGGYRRQVYNGASENPGSLQSTELWLQFDFLQSLTPQFALEIEGLLRQHHDFAFVDYYDWNQSYAYVSLRHTKFSVSLGYELYTYQPDVYQPNNFNVSGSYIASDNLLFRAFVGSREAGLRCINGVCRNFPGFNGATLEVVARY